MTREDVARTLRFMESIREQSYEAETKREERRLVREYGRMAKAIKPYIDGAIPYSEAA
jgi:hypothetical protein